MIRIIKKKKKKALLKFFFNTNKKQCVVTNNSSGCSKKKLNQPKVNLKSLVGAVVAVESIQPKICLLYSSNTNFVPLSNPVAAAEKIMNEISS